MSKAKTVLLCQDSKATNKEVELAKSLDIDLVVTTDQSARNDDFQLRLEDAGLCLYQSASPSADAVRVDFRDAALNHRVSDSLRNQAIAKAVGVKGSRKPSVLDATAGFGKDAFLLASLGCSVTMIERSPIVHAMLADGMERGREADDDTRASLDNMQLIRGDFLDMSEDLGSTDTVYLDPMFPARTKSARVKKDMYFLQNLLDCETDNAALLDCALSVARKRVVVKRGKASQALSSRKVDIEYKGSSSRYDVYLITP